MNAAGLTLPPAASAASDATAAFAAGLIDRSGKAPVIEAALAHRTGRPRPLPARAVLTALLCLALDDRPLFLTEATRLLFCQLSPASRRLLGVPGTAPDERAFLAAYRRVRYCFGAICSVADPSPLPKNRRLTAGELKARTKPMTPDQATAARARLETLVNALLEASVLVLTTAERAAFDGGTGLDATPVPLFSRGPSKRTGLCASDPDGGWYVREGDHREREDDDDARRNPPVLLTGNRQFVDGYITLLTGACHGSSRRVALTCGGGVVMLAAGGTSQATSATGCRQCGQAGAEVRLLPGAGAAGWASGGRATSGVGPLRRRRAFLPYRSCQRCLQRGLQNFCLGAAGVQVKLVPQAGQGRCSAVIAGSPWLWWRRGGCRRGAGGRASGRRGRRCR